MISLPVRRSLILHRAVIGATRTLPFQTASRWSSSSSMTAPSNPTGADVVQGPSLVRTASNPRRPRPSLLHLPGLRALPVWTKQLPRNSNTNSTLPPSNDLSVPNNAYETVVAYQDPDVTRAVQHLEAHYKEIREEYHAVAPHIQSDYKPDAEHSGASLVQRHTSETGGSSGTTESSSSSWDWHSYQRKGAVEPAFAQHFPVTTRALRGLDIFDGTPFGYAFFSTLHPHTTIAAHTSPINFRLRLHLALDVPDDDNDKKNTTMASATSKKKDEPRCGLVVAGVTHRWRAGSALVLDDAHEHAAHNRTDRPRVVLLVDVWHPDVTASERVEIVRMFQGAQEQGWLS